MNKETKLAVCPFCGGEAIIEDYMIGGEHVECVKCYAKSITTEDRQEAIKAWNTRSQ